MKLINIFRFILVFALFTSTVMAQDEELHPLKINGKYGYINVSGELKIKPHYRRAEVFSCGLALIQEEDTRFGYINTKGVVLFYVDGVSSWQNIHSFFDERAAVRLNRQWGFLDISGRFAIAPQFSAIVDFNEGVAAVKGTVSSNYVYIDKGGQNIFPNMSFKIAYRKSNGFMVIGEQIFEDYWIQGSNLDERIKVSGMRRGVIDGQGRIIIPIAEQILDTEVSDGLISSSRGFLNMQNEVVIKNHFQKSGRFYNGIIPISTDGKKYGIINIKDEYIVQEKYDLIQTFSEGYAVYMQDGKYGFLDRSGNIAISAQFDFAMPFNNELAFIRLNGVDGYITKTGNIYLSSLY
jgi:hypothetical protein